MTRVIAGIAGGRRLSVPAGDRVRPTSDRVKEALFSSLGNLDGLVVADLYAGSGGLGIEALSRGAARATFVESDRRTVRAIRENLVTAGVGDRAHVIGATAQSFAALPSGGPFDLILTDPPYDTPLDVVARVLEALLAAGAVRPGARVVVERDRRAEEPRLGMLSHDRDRTYGETLLRYYTHRPSRPAQTGPTPEVPR